jgi:hypothetical protein
MLNIDNKLGQCELQQLTTGEVDMGIVEAIEQRMSRPNGGRADTVLTVARTRVSTEEQARDDRLSLPVQRRMIQDWADRNSREVVRWFTLEGASAFRMDPRLWQEELEFIREYRHADGRKIREFLVIRQDRFSRQRYESAMVKQELMVLGVSVVLVTLPFDATTPEGVLLEAFSEAEAQVSSMRTGRNTRLGMAQNVETRDPETGSCYKNGMRVHFGYAAKPVKKGEARHGIPIVKVVWDVDRTEVCGRPIYEWVHHILAELRGEQGMGFPSIAKYLNDVGLPTPSQWQQVKRGKVTADALMASIDESGPEWTEHQVRNLCAFDRVRIYSGEYLFGRTAKGLTQAPVDKSPEEWVPTKNAHPAILTPEEMQSVLLTNEERHNRWISYDPSQVNRRSSYLLSGGPLVCWCGRHMIGKKREKASYYVCSSVKIVGGACGPIKGIRKELIEELVVDFVLEQQWAPEFQEMVALELQKQQHTKRRRSRASPHREIDRLKRQRHRLIESIKKGVDPSAVTDEINDLQRQIDAKEKELRRPERPQKGVPIPPYGVEEFARKFREAPLHLQREYVRTFFEKIQVNPKTREITAVYYTNGDFGQMPESPHSVPLALRGLEPRFRG